MIVHAPRLPDIGWRDPQDPSTRCEKLETAIAETLNGFLARPCSFAATSTVRERQRIVRLLVKEVPINEEKIIIHHSISGMSHPDTAWLFPRLERSATLRPDVRITLVDSRERAEVSGCDRIVIDGGTHGDDADSFTERLSGEEGIFPVCAPGGLPGPRSLRRKAAAPGDHRQWREPADWPALSVGVGRSESETAIGPARTARLPFSAAWQGDGVILSNTAMARGGLIDGRFLRPVPEGVPTEDAYWRRTLRPVRRQPEVGAFVSRRKEEFPRDPERVS